MNRRYFLRLFGVAALTFSLRGLGQWSAPLEVQSLEPSADSGLSLRWVEQWDATLDATPTRFDAYYAVSTLAPEFAVRVHRELTWREKLDRMFSRLLA